MQPATVMINKRIFSVAATFAIVAAPQAMAISACEQSFREAYVAYPSLEKPSPAIKEAYEVYAIYSDYSNGLKEAYGDAQNLFRSLRVDAHDEDSVLNDLVSKMRSGQLCSSTNQPLSFSDIVKRLKNQ